MTDANSRETFGKKLKKEFTVLRDGKPGRRFRDFRKFQKETEGSSRATRISIFVVGVLLIVAGLAIGWLPGPGGFLAIVGIAMLGREIPGIAWVLDGIEVQIRRWIDRYVQLSIGWKIVVALFAGAIVACLVWAGWKLFF